jgi:hypothetical protein
MFPLSTHLRYSGRIATLGLAAGSLALVAGCATGAPSATEAKPITARAEVILAADETQQVSSLAASISVQIKNGDITDGNITGSIVAQLKPTLRVEDSANMSISGHPTHFTEIISGQTLYLKLPAPFASADKPWMKIPFSQISGETGSALSQLVQNAQSGNPAQQVQMLTGSKNVRAVGTQVIDGIRTTHYIGSVAGPAAPAAAAGVEKSELAQLTGAVQFNVWIDAQHHVRKLTVTEDIGGEQMASTMTLTGINQPVHIVLPRPRRVAALTGGSL